MERLNRDAERLADRFQLRYRAIEAERPNVKRRYGVCFSDGTIRIRLWHVVTRKPLKYSSLVNTLCHELAHLRHFNHGVRFKAFYLKILEHARREGIYQPGPPRETLPEPTKDERTSPLTPIGAEQLSLF
jgi:predicted metal-dependent hydrolase